MPTVGEIFRGVRILKKLSRREVAEAADASVSTIQRMEFETGYVAIETKIAAAKLSGIKLDVASGTITPPTNFSMEEIERVIAEPRTVQRSERPREVDIGQAWISLAVAADSLVKSGIDSEAAVKNFRRQLVQAKLKYEVPLTDEERKLQIVEIGGDRPPTSPSSNPKPTANPPEVGAGDTPPAVESLPRRTPPREPANQSGGH